MTNTKFRKRALLSSVAMLLVALVALGSATFAWFSTTSTATAEMINAKTNKSSNILLGEGNAAGTNSVDTGVVKWDNAITFAKRTSTNTTAMIPVTTSAGATWNTILADDYNTGYANATDTATPVTADIQTDGRYAKYTNLYIQSVAADKEIQIAVTATTTTGADDYLRVLLKPIAAQSGAATAAFASTEAGYSAIIFDDGTKNDRSSTGTWTASTDTASPSSALTGVFGNNGAVHLGKALTDQAYGFEVYVYYEGTDFDCKDINAGTDINVSFTVSEYTANP